eukprot:TRINITY_DN1932_c0_g1_i2.p2 TRINITY_DN1932_c0_g1~~TRINITY_DN1932_c0_g1_i2.p2  ORF type:complete len:100 (+),score=8.81 TRINITY_DN1932_c0_g1_i2:1398-1697(+)
MAFPGTVSFFSELFILVFVFSNNPFLALLTLLPLLFNAVYNIVLVTELLGGPILPNDNNPIKSSKILLLSKMKSLLYWLAQFFFWAYTPFLFLMWFIFF